MKNNFRMLYGEDITKSVRGLMMKTSELKSSIFRTLITGTVSNISMSKEYMAYVKGFLDQWESFAEDMKNKMSTASDSRSTRSIDYEVIKDFIYDKYDYDAMVSYADALSTGIQENKFQKKSDIDDFFSFTTDKAFGNRNLPDNVAGLVDYIVNLDQMESSLKINDNNRRMFNAIRNDSSMFNRTDRIVLYNNVKKIVEFLTDKAMVNKLISTNSNGVYISAVNSIIEFAVYSLAIFAIRIYAINMFVYPYIYSCPTTDALNESSEINLPTTGNDKDIILTTLRDANEVDYKTPGNLREFGELLNKASTCIGADGMYNGNKPDWNKPSYINVHKSDLTNNAFSQKLYVNDMYKFLIDECVDWSERMTKDASLRELNGLLKSIMYNSTHSIGGTSSPRNEFFALVRGVSCDNTSKGYQQLFADLNVFAICLLGNLERKISFNASQTENILNDPRYSISTGTLGNENSKLMSELYNDLVQLILQKARDIETKYNAVNKDEVHKIAGLNIGKSTLKEIGTTNDMTNSVPDTYRVPIDLTDLYALPAFEYMQFYDEAVKHNYHLEDDWYFSEAFNIGEIFNKIMAFIQGRLKAVKTWWNNKNLQDALKWVTEHGDAVAKMNFANQSMEVLPFKNNGTDEKIELGSVISKMLQAFATVKDSDMETPDKVTEFIKKMYPDPVVYDWFNEEKTKGEAAAKLHSYLLFRELNNVSTSAEKPVTITGQEINKRCAWWIDTCKNGKKLYEDLEKYINELNKRINSFKQTVSKYSNVQQPQQEPLASASSQNDSQNQQKQQNTSQQQSGPKPENIRLMTIELENLILRVLIPMTNICMEYVNTEYRYIKQAHSLGSASQITPDQSK